MWDGPWSGKCSQLPTTQERWRLQMRNLLLYIAVCLSMFVSPAKSHQVWCHGTCKSPTETVEFFHKAKEVYVSLTNLEKIWQQASYSLENGILAEFDSKIDNAKSLRVEEYRTALAGYVEMRAAMDELDAAI